jgi:GNAT superfamily N-acetyltransferase
MDSYARDPMGGGQPLSAEVKGCLVAELAKRNDVVSVLCYVDQQPAGLMTAIEGFSTFNAKPLLNIHDAIVLAPYRGLGISQLLLQRIKTIAQKRGCCKLTLEVLTGNKVAQRAYHKFGFKCYELDPKMGTAIFLEKSII